jgi:hypothetical protein
MSLASWARKLSEARSISAPVSSSTFAFKSTFAPSGNFSQAMSARATWASSVAALAASNSMGSDLATRRSLCVVTTNFACRVPQAALSVPRPELDRFRQRRRPLEGLCGRSGELLVIRPASELYLSRQCRCEREACRIAPEHPDIAAV